MHAWNSVTQYGLCGVRREPQGLLGLWQCPERKGRAEGERETNLRNAKNLKALGVDVETISKVTGLTRKEIDSL